MAEHLFQYCKPLTAFPFLSGETHREYPPAEALRPYVRCYWGTQASGTAPLSPHGGLVVPDLCADLIITFLEGETLCKFCGVDDRPFRSSPPAETFGRFAVRFYCWAVPLFTSESMTDAANAYVDAEAYFPGVEKELAPLLREAATVEERILLAEKWLLRRLNARREKAAVLNAAHRMMASSGNLTIEELCRREVLSPRAIERLFREYVGLSPKKISGLIRYQMLWREVVTAERFDPHDAVLHYGYTDQPHLLRDFKRYHTMTPAQAKAEALSHFYKTAPDKK